MKQVSQSASFIERLRKSNGCIYQGPNAETLGKKIERMFGLRLMLVVENEPGKLPVFPLLMLDEPIPEDASRWLTNKQEELLNVGYTTPKAKKLRSQFVRIKDGLKEYHLSLIICKEAQEWISAHGGSHEELWQDCERPDWLLYVLLSLSPKDRCAIQSISAQFALLLRETPDEVKPFLKIVQAYGDGLASKEAWTSAKDNISKRWSLEEREAAWANAPLELRQRFCEIIRNDFVRPEINPDKARLL